MHKCTFPVSRFFSNQICFVVITCGFLLSCGTSPDNSVIRFGLASAPITLDPRFATDAISSRLNRLIYRQLIDFDAASKPVPSLASWEKLTDTHYRFHLGDKGRVFHDGARLTAHDIKATYDSILDEATGSPHRATLYMLEKVQVIDDEQVDFVLKHPDPLFPGYLEIGILPAAKLASGHPFNTHPVGSGPFRLLSWEQKERVDLMRVRDQQIISMLHVQDENTRVLKLIRGELDMLQNDIDAELVKFLQRQPSVYVTSKQGRNFSYIGFNMEDESVGRQSIREAIAYAVDRQAIIDYLFSGRASLASSILTPDHWAGHPALSKYAYAPERSRQLLSSMGYDASHPLKLVYKTSSNAFRIRLATIIQHQLSKVGIDVELRTYDWGTFYGDIKAGNFQMYSLAWVGINLPDIFRNVFHSASVPPTGANRGKFSDEGVDDLLNRVQHEQELESQAAIYRQLQEIVFRRLPYVPLWYEDQVLMARKSIKGYEIQSDGNYDGLEYVERTT